MVWPFGRYNDLALEAAQKAGMGITLTLDPVAASSDRLEAVARKYPTLNPETGTFQYSFFERKRPPLRRFIQVEVAGLIEKDENAEKSFSRFLERVKTLAPGRVYLEPVVRIDNTLNALFQNKMVPVIQDRLTRLSWHTNRRAGTEVHLILSDELFNRIEASDYKSFFSDMGKSAPCSGLLVADVKFNEQFIMMMEQATPPNTPLPIWNPQKTRMQRTELAKNSSVSRVLNILNGLEAFQQWQPFLDVGLLVSSEMLKTVDIISLKNLLRYFDYIKVDLRAEEQPMSAMRELTELDAFAELGGYFTVLVKFDAGVSEHQLKKQLSALSDQGIVDFGYAHDDFLQDRPDLEMIRPIISARTFPFMPK
jgi:biofilm PGA synthesis lipoprotein PgaB